MNPKRLLTFIAVFGWLLPYLTACVSSNSPVSTIPSITLDGDQCAYSGPQSIPAGKLSLDWIVKDKSHENYALVIATFAEGKTIKDMQKWPSTDQPPWLKTILAYGEGKPDSRQTVTADVSDGPIYFVCFYAPPETKLGQAGPLAVEAAKSTGLPQATLTPHAAPTAAQHPKPIVIDTDMAPDDWMAILYLLQRTDISVKAITVSGTGEAHCEPGIKHALGLVALAGNEPVPVACGRQTPLAGSHIFPDSWRQAVDNLLGTGLTLPEVQNPNAGKTAVQLLASTLESSPEKITLLTLGSLTNVADLLQGSPSAADKIAMIYIMGGAVHLPGNLGTAIQGNQVAEWNLYIDPKADNIVFKAGIPITLVALDATQYAKVTTDFYQRLQTYHLTPEAGWVYDLFTKGKSTFLSGSYYFWDPLTAAILSDESLATYEQDPLCVVEEEGSQSGQTKVTPGCPDIRVAITADSARFEQIFLDTLNNP